MIATIISQFDVFTRQRKYILHCGGILNGTIMGDTKIEAIASLAEINGRRISLGLSAIILQCVI